MRNLIIVDDEKNIRNGLSMMIEREFPNQYQIRMAAQGQEALDMFRKDPAEVVITDIRMPVMDGITLIESLAGLAGTTEVKPVLIILSGYDDFEYAKAAIRYQVKEYLLKPIRRDELFTALRKTEETLQWQADIHQRMASGETYLQQLQAHALKELLEQPRDTAIDLEAASRAIGFEQYVKPFRVAAIKYKYEDGNTMNKEELKQLIDCVMETSEERNGGNCFDSSGRLVLIGRSERWCADLAEKFKEREMDGLFIGISEEGTRMEHIRKGYDQALKALGYTFVHPNVKQASYQELHEQLNMYPIPEDHLRRLGNMLGTDREREIKLLLLEIFHIPDMPHVDVSYLEQVSTRINEQILDEVFRMYGESMVEVLKLYRKVGTMDNHRHFHAYFRNLEHLLLSVNEYVKSIRSAHSEHSEMKAAVTYMEANYHKPLNMAMVSNHVSLNYSYFSEAFKAHTGENFVLYLKKLRISRAKELLHSSNLKLADIGKQVGFENMKQFSRVFKELEGISPHEYRLKVYSDAGNR
ncbi:response regulator [Paenibacillus sp. JCM 10914]|uniref:response regulator n=1 Tax=Paenibacillus sp. JCM 10914 TaxID=1236974 RepID=UPI0005616BF3|nr:response regulator [Paenibacillus sp. JCM 10914]